MELSVDNVDQFSGDAADPETILLISEIIKKAGITFED